jgi:hypothetical protein
VLCNNVQTIEFNAFFTIGVKVLEGFCYYRNEIYKKFFEIVNKRSSDDDKNRYFHF